MNLGCRTTLLEGKLKRIRSLAIAASMKTALSRYTSYIFSVNQSLLAMASYHTATPEAEASVRPQPLQAISVLMFIRFYFRGMLFQIFASMQFRAKCAQNTRIIAT